MLGNVRRKEWGVRPLGSPTASASTLALSLFVRTRVCPELEVLIE